MPNRILKDSIRESATLNQLTWFQEVVFYRLLVSADDYGRLDARTDYLKSLLFPLRSPKKAATEDQVKDALNMLSIVGIVQFYEVDGRPYLQFTSWEKHQQVRNHRSKYPDPSEGTPIDINGNRMISDDIRCGLESNPIQSESNPNPKEYSRGKATATAQQIADLYNSLCPSLQKVVKLTDSRKKAIQARLKDFGGDESLFTTLFQKAEASSFLTGGGDRGWKADFDWLIKTGNATRVIEGTFDNKKPSGNGLESRIQQYAEWHPEG